ncbi:gene transfer agent family protein [Paracoccus sp. 1_MG-2023]|uniref:gene transfer agent family protein n=1 Tax=unclassified Paracoccus (in: a-proteobacteria) TaxID=2688777 RepID=UPI001C08EE73|nr:MULTISPECIES: gene transfer agent family protein [unclassified Paracoccus (in: a-proteobacteria)]MBU2958634.1 gene transfer agent family protein [Paracoccus sp. C2R09]MDO6667627.1 gene transfer agent family protein [Paracoccus sp. 1_MG-2023]
MANPMRGEVAVTLDGHPHAARLTLGALAELEAVLGEADLQGVVARMEAGRISGREVLAVLTAGLRGGGWQGQASDLVDCDIAGGPVAAAQAAARLLALAFRMPG